MRVIAQLTVLLLIAFSPHVRAATLEPGCKAGDPFRCLEGTPSLPAAAKACELGQPRGCVVAGGLVQKTQPSKPARALGFFDRACELGDAAGCFESATLRAEAKDYPRAFVALYKSCRQGYGPACTAAGSLHANGSGTPKDSGRAALAYRNGCERRDPNGCLLLGPMLVKPVDAAAAYQQACLLGSAGGCSRLAVLTAQGVKPVPTLRPLKDSMVETEKVLRSLPGGSNPIAFIEVANCPAVSDPACVGGDLAVCQQSADLQQNGGDGEAAYCMKRHACEVRGDGYACEQLGFSYEGGALPADSKRALAWYEKGCANGSPASCASAVRLVATVEAMATPNQRSTRTLELLVRGCALDDAGDCSLVYKQLLSKVADPVLAQRAWITVGRWCEVEKRDGPVCSVVDDRRKAIVLEADCQAGQGVACREAAALLPDPEREAALLGKGCGLGDCLSCVGTRPNPAKAAQVCPAECKAAASEGAEPKACGLAIRALAAQGGPANEKKAIAFAEEQCKRGFSCGLLAELFVVATSLSAVDEKRVGASLDRACAEGRSGTCQARDELALVKPARELCTQGKIEGCMKLGEQLTLSKVELPQISLAWERACALGSNLGCVRHWASLRTVLSKDSTVIEQSHQKATAACDAGEVDVCVELANHLKFRSADPEAIAELKTVGAKVIDTLGPQCDRGDASACESAANFLRFKLDGEDRATAFLKKACTAGAAGRCMEFADHGARTKDYARAVEYAAKACTFGSPAGCRMLVKYRGSLNDATLADADRALGVACGNSVVDACALAADAGVPMRIEAPVAPVPVSQK